MPENEETREVLVHLNVKVPVSLSAPAAEADAVERAMAAARHSDEAFMDLIALVDVT